MAVDRDFVTAKGNGAEDVLQGFALAAAFDQFTEPIFLIGGKGALEVQVQLHSGQLEQVRQQQFGLESGRIDPLFGEELGAALNDLENSQFG